MKLNKNMYELKIGRKGLLKAVELEKGCDIVAGYVERDLNKKDKKIKQQVPFNPPPNLPRQMG